MAGGGAVSPEALALCKQGIRNVLGHLGLIDVAPSPTGATELLELPGARAFVYAPTDGIFEPVHRLGTRVSRGDLAGRIHCLWDADRPPEPVIYAADGILYGLRPIGRVRPGNCCLVVASTYSGQPLEGTE